MAKGFIGATSYKAYLGATKMKEGYIGATRVYSAGSTVTYVVDGESYTEEVDSEASCLSPKSFTPTKSGWTFVGWRQDKTASGSVLSNLTMGDSPITLYAVFRLTVTVTYYNGSATASSKTGYRYYNTGNVANPSFTLTQAAMSGWTARGWSTSTAGNGGITYANGAAFTRDSNITLYGMYQQTVTVTYYNGSSTASTTSGTRYYNPGTGNISNPTFTLYQVTMTGWATRGWSASTAGNGEISYNNGAAFTRDSNITLYGMYGQSITLSYNGNGATGGSNVAQIGTRYHNSGTGAIANPSFTLSASGFVRTNYAFAKWALNSGSGTQYAVGASITLDANATMYAVWVQNVQEFNYTGGMQSYTVPITGIYRFDVYGAQGGSTAADSGGTGGAAAGGYGGVAYGYAKINAGTVLYIGVGGCPNALNSQWKGGWNGGGSAYKDPRYSGGGGGCTHVGTFNSTLQQHGSRSGLYIVAGGGGGGQYGLYSHKSATGGAGGGVNGTNGTEADSGGAGGGGAVQSSVGASYLYESVITGGGFGYGGSCTGAPIANGGYLIVSGGGGGLYGGGNGYRKSGGGGSGYTGGVPSLTHGGATYSPSMSIGQRSGNGYAKITFICAI